MADAVVLELLRRRALLVDVVALARAERAVHLPARDIDRRDRFVVEAALVARVLEHRERLAAVVDEHPLAPELVPGERGSGARAVRKKPSISLIWAKWTAGGFWPFSSGPKPCDGADWPTCTVPFTSPSIEDVPAAATECFGSNPSSFRKPPAIVAISGE